MNDELCELSQPSAVEENKQPNQKRGHRIRIKLKRHKTRDKIETTQQQQQQEQQQQQQSTDQPKAKRALFNIGGTSGSVTSSHSSSTSSLKGMEMVTMNGHEPSSPMSPLTVSSMSTNSLLPLVDVDDEQSLRISRKESLAQVFQEKLSAEASEADEAEGK